MAGNIYHEWNGTVLTITSDSGTSSMNLIGEKGDIGIRGPQGISGNSVYNQTLNLSPEQRNTARYNINAYQAIKESGENVNFIAGEGLPLTVKTTFDPNITDNNGTQKINTINSIKLTANGEEHTVSFNSPVYGGSYDWSSGELESEWIYRQLTSDGGWIWNSFDVNSYCFIYIEDKGTIVEDAIICSHLPQTIISSTTTETGINVTNQFAGTQARISVRPDLTQIPDLASWKAYLNAQAAAGTPVQVIYKRVKPKTTYHAAYNLETVADKNTFSSDPGLTTITNLKGNSGVINNLLERVAALEDNIGG